MGDESHELPRAVITRIIKQSLPENVQVAKDAKLALAKAAKYFILYLSSCSNDFCKSCNRTTIGVNHVYGACEELEFPDFVEKLKQFLEVYKKEQAAKKSSKKKAKESENTPTKDTDMKDGDTKEKKDSTTQNATDGKKSDP